MLICTQFGSFWRLSERTLLYRIVLFVGRWSMVDIFMESLLGALVKFGRLATIEPGGGALAFCAVVILTMIGAEAFDPRLMWDAVESRPVRGAAGLPVAGAARS
jgi:paraquat-inducible protein A